jgi:hypothetical protein
MNFAYSQLLSTYFLAYFELGLSTNLSTNPSNGFNHPQAQWPSSSGQAAQVE